MGVGTENCQIWWSGPWVGHLHLRRRLLTCISFVPVAFVILFNNTIFFSTPMQQQQYRTSSYHNTEQNLRRRHIPIPPSTDAQAIEIISSKKTKIWHYPSHREICLQMDYATMVALCPHPDLMGRISGSSLAVLDEWEYHPSVFNVNDLYCGSYKNVWLPPGQYNLEIIVVICNSFGLTSPMRTMNFTKWLEYDFKKDCLEDPARSQITSSSSTLTIEAEVSSTSEDKEQLQEGRWTIDKSKSANYGPLSTRYQPQDCRGEISERCAVPMNNSHLEAFNFVWRNNTWLEKLKQHQLDLGFKAISRKTVDKVKELEMRAHGGTGLDVDSSKRMKGTPELSKICLVGYSHSYHLIDAFWANNLGHLFIWAPAIYPTQLSTKFFEQYYHTRNCTKFVIGVGQHPAGWPGGGPPYSLKQWRDEMTSVVTNEEIFKIDGKIKLYLRSIHHNPIGDMIGKCQPTDWRSPTVIDSYNFILEKLVLDANNSRVDYLDTTFITKPVWDTAYDWCHLPLKVSSVEALYIAYVLLVN